MRSLALRTNRVLSGVIGLPLYIFAFNRRISCALLPGLLSSEAHPFSHVVLGGTENWDSLSHSIDDVRTALKRRFWWIPRSEYLPNIPSQSIGDLVPKA